MYGGLRDEMNTKTNESNIKQHELKKTKKEAFHYWHVNGKDYKLKLNTAMIEKLENKYNTNILTLISDGDIPQLSIMLTIVQAAIAPWGHGINYQEVQALYDQWLTEGGNQMELFTQVIMPTFAVSGFFTKKQTALMMENLKDLDGVL